MKGRVVVIGPLFGRPAAALMVDGQLEDLALDPGDAVPLAPGAICRGIIDRPVKGQGGAFLRLPAGARGFLRDAGGLASGRPVLVQVSGAAEPGKALPVSARLLFRSRYAIITPSAPGANVSRRIRDTPMGAALREIAEAAMAGTSHGVILRSAAAEAEPDDVLEDIVSMRDLAATVTGDVVGEAALLLDAPEPVEVAWCDWASPVPDEIAEGEDAMAVHGVDDAVDALLSPRVALTGGGHMMIEPTRALVAVDVNTGADVSPAAGLKANIAAARALPRELRLRGLGGQVVIDFAPMSKRDRATLEQQLRVSFRSSGGETSLAGWTPLGNYELQRKRDRVPLALILSAPVRGLTAEGAAAPEKSP